MPEYERRNRKRRTKFATCDGVSPRKKRRREPKRRAKTINAQKERKWCNRTKRPCETLDSNNRENDCMHCLRNKRPAETRTFPGLGRFCSDGKLCKRHLLVDNKLERPSITCIRCMQKETKYAYIRKKIVGGPDAGFKSIHLSNARKRKAHLHPCVPKIVFELDQSSCGIHREIEWKGCNTKIPNPKSRARKAFSYLVDFEKMFEFAIDGLGIMGGKCRLYYHNTVLDGEPQYIDTAEQVEEAFEEMIRHNLDGPLRVTVIPENPENVCNLELGASKGMTGLPPQVDWVQTSETQRLLLNSVPDRTLPRLPRTTSQDPSMTEYGTSRTVYHGPTATTIETALRALETRDEDRGPTLRRTGSQDPKLRGPAQNPNAMIDLDTTQELDMDEIELPSSMEIKPLTRPTTPYHEKSEASKEHGATLQRSSSSTIRGMVAGAPRVADPLPLPANGPTPPKLGTLKRTITPSCPTQPTAALHHLSHPVPPPVSAAQFMLPTRQMKQESPTGQRTRDDDNETVCGDDPVLAEMQRHMETKYGVQVPNAKDPHDLLFKLNKAQTYARAKIGGYWNQR